jgi:hypothetical protein
MTPQTQLKDLLAKLLALRIGARNGITAERLAVMLVVTPRTLRTLISDLRNEGMAICGHPTTGYYIAETAEELQTTCDFLRSRALRSLYLESRLRKVPLAQLIGQLQLELNTNTKKPRRQHEHPQHD